MRFRALMFCRMLPGARAIYAETSCLQHAQQLVRTFLWQVAEAAARPRKPASLQKAIAAVLAADANDSQEVAQALLGAKALLSTIVEEDAQEAQRQIDAAREASATQIQTIARGKSARIKLAEKQEARRAARWLARQNEASNTIYRMYRTWRLRAMAETFGHLAAAHKKVLQEEKARREKAAKEVAEQRRREHAESLRIADVRAALAVETRAAEAASPPRTSQALAQAIQVIDQKDAFTHKGLGTQLRAAKRLLAVIREEEKAEAARLVAKRLADETAAALQIQSLARGHRGRQHTIRLRQEKARQAHEAIAASRIQSIARMRQGQSVGQKKRAKKRAQLELKAAIQIQSLARMKSGQIEAERRRDAKLRSDAAIKIQSARRMKLGRNIAVQVRREQQEQTAAIKIQSLGRMKMGRDEVEARREARVRVIAATRIQSVIRGKFGRSEAEAQWDLVLQHHAATQIQSAIRMKLGRDETQAIREIKEYLLEVQKRNSAATRIQSAARRRAAVNQVGEIKERESAAVQIQSAARVKISRNAVHGIRMDKAAVVLQSQVRSHLAKGRMKTIILRLPPKMLIKFRLGRVARAARRARREALERKAARDRAAELIDDQNYLSQETLKPTSISSLELYPQNARLKVKPWNPDAEAQAELERRRADEERLRKEAARQALESRKVGKKPRVPPSPKNSRRRRGQNKMSPSAGNDPGRHRTKSHGTIIAPQETRRASRIRAVSARNQSRLPLSSKMRAASHGSIQTLRSESNELDNDTDEKHNDAVEKNNQQGCPVGPRKNARAKSRHTAVVKTKGNRSNLQTSVGGVDGKKKIHRQGRKRAAKTRSKSPVELMNQIVQDQLVSNERFLESIRRDERGADRDAPLRKSRHDRAKVSVYANSTPFPKAKRNKKLHSVKHSSALPRGKLPAMSHGGRRGLPKYHSHSKSPETQPGSLVPIRVARHSNMSFPPRKLSSKSRSRKLHTAAVLSSKQVSASMPRGSNVGDTYLLQHARAYLFELLQQENARETERQLILAENRPAGGGDDETTRRLKRIFHAERKQKRDEISRVVQRTRDELGAESSVAKARANVLDGAGFVSTRSVDTQTLRRQFPVLPKLDLSAMKPKSRPESSPTSPSTLAPLQLQPSFAELNDDFFESHPPIYKQLFARYGGRPVVGALVESDEDVASGSDVGVDGDDDDVSSNNSGRSMDSQRSEASSTTRSVASSTWADNGNALPSDRTIYAASTSPPTTRTATNDSEHGSEQVEGFDAVHPHSARTAVALWCKEVGQFLFPTFHAGHKRMRDVQMSSIGRQWMREVGQFLFHSTPQFIGQHEGDDHGSGFDLWTTLEQIVDDATTT
eukprot:INCI5044.6.p1 GENE.INCI5044.6~~INCI5044.6.p1  ORF type:complete len:1348 (+),score=259.31 INCI5044.6:2522-6565(+)